MGDDVQRSLELLDRVLSEFDDLENGNPPVGGGNGNGGGNGGGGGGGDDSPSLHSEDDGYMSMNGRRAKFVLNLRPQVQMGPGGGGLPLPPDPPPPDPPPPNLLRRLTNAPTTASADSLQFPPPPEEAERIISTLLPRVSPGNSSKRSTNGFRRPHNGSLKLGNGYDVEDQHITTATQTTLPKTRHQRPYGWENGPTIPTNYHPNHQPVNPAVKFGSLPYDGSLQWLNPLPPRTLPTAMDRHREVRRRVGGGGGEEPAEGGGEAITQQLRIVTESCDDDAANFSDDSLEELLPPPPPPLSKRGSIAWEVPLDMDDEALLTPGSTKVIGRRRRRSTDRSSTGSMSRLKDVSGQDEWPDPPTGTEDGSLSPFSDSSHADAASRNDPITLPAELNAADLSAGGTYVIRKGRRKERRPLQSSAAAVSRASSKSSVNSTSHKHRLSPPKFGEMKRCSSTFDNIKSLLKDGLIEGLDDDPPDFAPPTPPPALLKVVSLPSLLVDDHTNTHTNNRTINRTKPSNDRLSPSATPELNTVKHKSQGKTVVDSISSTKVSIDVGVQVTDDFSSTEPSKNESENATVVTKAEISTQIQPEELCELIDKANDVAVEVVDLSLVETDTVKPESEQSKESIVISEPQVSQDESSVILSKPIEAVADSSLQTDIIIRPVRKSISLEENCVFRKALPLEPESFYEKDLPLEPDSTDYDKALPKEPVEVYEKDLPSEPEPDVYDDKSLPPVPPPSSRESDVDSLSGREIEENEKNSTGTMILHVEIGKEKAVFNPWDKTKETQVIPVLEEDRKLKIEDEDENEKRDELKSEKPPADFNVKVEVLQHEFGPLPPSPVEEDEDEYADILRPSPVKTDEPFYRCVEPPASDPIGSRFLNRPPEPPPHRDATSSLKTRSMDAGFTRNHKNQHSASRKEIPSERRTLPSELPGPSRRRTFQKRTHTCSSSSGQSPREENRHMQVSCSLPETPIFARGCDIPRTPLRRTPEVTPGSARTAPRPGGLQTTGSYRMTTAGHGTVGSGVSLGQAMVGAELLRLNGGPGRGWYPRHRQQPRPASVEHLDHLARSGLSPSVLSPPGSAWDSSRKPLTLPPNLTPKFFQRSPRDALRRVTSLLIRKGNSSKDQKKEVLSPTQGVEPGDGRQKRGFFKSFWKKSRQYSLEQQ